MGILDLFKSKSVETKLTPHPVKVGFTPSSGSKVEGGVITHALHLRQDWASIRSRLEELKEAAATAVGDKKAELEADIALIEDYLEGGKS